MGKHLPRAAALLLALSALAGCATVRDYFGDGDNSEPPAELTDIETTLQVRTLWSRSVGSGFDGQFLRLRPAVSDGRIFAADHKGRVWAYDALDGGKLWMTDTDAPLAGGPGAGDGLAVVGSSDGEVLALAAEDGTLRWRARVSSEVLATPLVADGLVVARTVDGKLFGLSAENGEPVWVYDRTVPALSLRGTSSPALGEGTVVAGFDSGRLVALSLRDGQSLWERRISVPRGRSELERLVDIDADPVIADGVVYAVTFNGRVAALDLLTGEEIWRRDMSSNSGLWVGPRQVFVTDDEGNVWALDRRTSSSMWRQTKLAHRRLSAPARVGEYLVVGDFEGYVHWLRREDGQFAARIKVDGEGVMAQPVVTADAVYVYGRGGKLTALAPAE